MVSRWKAPSAAAGGIGRSVPHRVARRASASRSSAGRPGRCGARRASHPSTNSTARCRSANRAEGGPACGAVPPLGNVAPKSGRHACSTRRGERPVESDGARQAFLRHSFHTLAWLAIRKSQDVGVSNENTANDWHLENNCAGHLTSHIAYTILPHIRRPMVGG